MIDRKLVLLLGLLALPATAAAHSAGLPEDELAPKIVAATAASPFEVGVWPGDPFPGTLVVVDVAASEELASAKGTLRGRRVAFHPLEDGGLRGLVPLPDDAKPGRAVLQLEVRTKTGRAWKRKVELRVQPVRFDEDQLTVDAKFTQLPKEALDRIAADRASLAAMWKRGSAPAPHFQENFILPRESRLTAPYGTRRVFNGATKGVHRGLDLDGRVGEPIHAPNAGVVTFAGDLYYSGGTVFVDHGGGLYTGYFHMDRMDVKVGDRVAKGEKLGTVGKSGRVTGPHLHWAAKVGGVYVNPSALLRFDFSRPMVGATSTVQVADDMP